MGDGTDRPLTAEQSNVHALPIARPERGDVYAAGVKVSNLERELAAAREEYERLQTARYGRLRQ